MAIRWSTACGQAFFIEVKRGPNVGAVVYLRVIELQ
jgi:hypothetical protein